MFFFILFVSLIAICFIFVFVSGFKSNRDTSYSHRSTSLFPESDETHSVISRKPRISAEVSDTFYTQVQDYCQSHSLTVSEFIRRSAKDYMDRNL